MVVNVDGKTSEQPGQGIRKSMGNATIRRWKNAVLVQAWQQAKGENDNCNRMLYSEDYRGKQKTPMMQG